jgi:hypothetical protein
MEDKVDLTDTPDVFLRALKESLRKKEGVDAGIAEILANHILSVAPAQNAVPQAKNAILKLAGERAISPKPGVANG